MVGAPRTVTELHRPEEVCSLVKVVRQKFQIDDNEAVVQGFHSEQCLSVPCRCDARRGGSSCSGGGERFYDVATAVGLSRRADPSRPTKFGRCGVDNGGGGGLDGTGALLEWQGGGVYHLQVHHHPVLVQPAAHICLFRYRVPRAAQTFVGAGGVVAAACVEEAAAADSGVMMFGLVGRCRRRRLRQAIAVQVLLLRLLVPRFDPVPGCAGSDGEYTHQKKWRTSTRLADCCSWKKLWK